jgi:hypothetical protein
LGVLESSDVGSDFLDLRKLTEGVLERPDGTTPVFCTPGPGTRACGCVGHRDCDDMNKAKICRKNTTQCGKGSDGKNGCVCIAKN